MVIEFDFVLYLLVGVIMLACTLEAPPKFPSKMQHTTPHFDGSIFMLHFVSDRIDPDCYPKVHKWSFEWFYGFCWIFWGVAISIYLSAYTNIYLSFRDSTRIFQIEMFRGYLPILNGNLLSFIH